MTRTTRYKTIQGGALIALVGLVFLIAYLSDWNGYVVLVTALVLFVPGRIQGRYYRDLHHGRKALEVGDCAASVRYTTAFLDAIRTRPALKKLLWLSGAIYTPDAEAMALNNIGSAHLPCGRFDEAEAAFASALHVDPLYPLPFFNLAILSQVRGDEVESARLLGEAQRLGYTRGSLDQVIHRAQAILSHVEGRDVE